MIRITRIWMLIWPVLHRIVGKLKRVGATEMIEITKK